MNLCCSSVVAISPNDGVCRHDELRLVGQWVLEQFTVGLNEHISLFRQLQSVHTGRI